MNTFGFVDLNLPLPGANEAFQVVDHRERLAAAQALGYGHVALSRTVTASGLATLVRDRRGLLLCDTVGERLKLTNNTAQAWVPLPAGLATPPPSEPQSSGAPMPRHPALRQHSRLTVILNDATDSAKLAASRKVTNCYDVLAVQPLSDRAFASACTVLDIDVITADFCGRRLPFRMRISLLREAIRRGIRFELIYSPLLREPGTRTRLLANASQLVHLTGGKGIIISSGARRAAELRGPVEAASLTKLLGMSRGAARDALLGTGHAVLRHGAVRRHGGRCITVLPAEAGAAAQDDESHRWPAGRTQPEPDVTVGTTAMPMEAATDDAFIAF